MAAHTVQNGSVRVDGIEYHHPSLHRYEGLWVEVGPAVDGRVSVFTFTGGNHLGFAEAAIPTAGPDAQTITAQSARECADCDHCIAAYHSGRNGRDTCTNVATFGRNPECSSMRATGAPCGPAARLWRSRK